MIGEPLWFIYGNCVYGSGPEDAWAGFALKTSSYAYLSDSEKQARFLDLLGALEAVEADVQLLRIGTQRDPRVPVGGEIAVPSGAHMDHLSRYLDAHAEHLGEIKTVAPHVFLLVSLSEPQRDVASYLSRAMQSSPKQWLASLRHSLLSRSNLLRASALEETRVKADRIHDLLASFLPARPMRGPELQWLVRRSYCRGLREPDVDGLHQPRALAFERNGEAVLAPLEGDVLRWLDCVVEHRPRALRIESELGVSWQALLVLGALPETVRFPGARAELMFAPVESLPFEVDITLNARFLPNELALRIARRRIQDADQIVKAEADGEQGVSDLGHHRSMQARDLLSYLQSSSRPPLLRSTFSVAVGAPDEKELEARVEAVRRAYGEVRLHRPLGDQLRLFWQHLPGQRTRVSGYDDTLTAEQVAAMMPTAAHRVGARRGFHLGRTLSGSARPVLFNLREGSDSDRNTAILSVGALGSGKTTLDQKLKYEAFLLGGRVIDVDPKGDHRFHLLDEVAPHVECLTLEPDMKLRGMLDPLRVAPPHLRQDAAVSFLRDLLPTRAEPAWETALLAAVDAVIRHSREPTCLQVVQALEQGDEIDVQVAKTLEIYARSGLTQLGFADPQVRLPPIGAAQVTYLPIRDLPGPQPGTPRAEHSQAERVGEQIVRLIAMLAMHLLALDRDRLKVFSFDEGF